MNVGVLLLPVTLISNAAHHCKFAARVIHRCTALSQYILQVINVSPISLLLAGDFYSYIH
jgi:hypothetical protein